MTYGANGIITDLGAGGTLFSSLSSSNIAATQNASTKSDDLVVLIAYVTGQDCMLARDAGDGWMILAGLYNGTYGALIAALIASSNGATTLAGLTLPGLAAYTAKTLTFSASPTGAQKNYRFDIHAAAQGSPQNRAVDTAASSTTINLPAMQFCPNGGQQHFEVYGLGYDNAGVVTTVGAPTSGSERLDTGQVSPPHGIAGGDFSIGPAIGRVTNGWQSEIARTATLAVAKTNKIGMCARIPVTANLNATAMRQRFMSARRFG